MVRTVPGTSALHRLGAATKLLVLAAVTIVSLLLPGWPSIAVLAVILVAGAAAARLPRTVIPRISWWIVAIVLLGGVLATAGNGITLYTRSLLLTVLFLALSLLVVWTTRVDELPAAFARIASPLRKLGAPVDEWAHTVTLAVRTLPLLRDEIRVLIAGTPAACVAARGRPTDPDRRPLPRTARPRGSGGGLGGPPGIRPRPRGDPARRHAVG